MNKPFFIRRFEGISIHTTDLIRNLLTFSLLTTLSSRSTKILSLRIKDFKLSKQRRIQLRSLALRGLHSRGCCSLIHKLALGESESRVNPGCSQSGHLCCRRIVSILTLPLLNIPLVLLAHLLSIPLILLPLHYRI